MKPIVMYVIYLLFMVIMAIAGNERYLLVSLGKNTDVDEWMEEQRNVLRKIKGNSCSKYLDGLSPDPSCTTRLRASAACYQDQIQVFNRAPLNLKQNAGCVLIEFLVNCCDQLLCKPPNRDASIKEYSQIVKAIFSPFDRNRCKMLASFSKAFKLKWRDVIEMNFM